MPTWTHEQPTRGVALHYRPGLPPDEAPTTWQSFKRVFPEALDQYRHWRLRLGDLAVLQADRWNGREYDEEFTQLCAERGVDMDQIRDWERVARAIPWDLREPSWTAISISHMRAVAARDIPLKKRIEFLNDAQRGLWSKEQLRQAVKNWRKASGNLFPTEDSPVFTVQMTRKDGWERTLALRIIDELTEDELASFLDSLTARLGALRATGVIGDDW